MNELHAIWCKCRRCVDARFQRRGEYIIADKLVTEEKRRQKAAKDYRYQNRDNGRGVRQTERI